MRTKQRPFYVKGVYQKHPIIRLLCILPTFHQPPPKVEYLPLSSRHTKEKALVAIDTANIFYFKIIKYRQVNPAWTLDYQNNLRHKKHLAEPLNKIRVRFELFCHTGILTWICESILSFLNLYRNRNDHNHHQYAMGRRNGIGYSTNRFQEVLYCCASILGTCTLQSMFCVRYCFQTQLI